MYLKLCLESISTTVLTAAAFEAWRTILIGAGTFDPISGMAVGVMAAIATAMAVITLSKLIATIRCVAGSRRRNARWAAQDRAHHQAQWDAAAETTLATSRKQFTDGLRKP